MRANQKYGGLNGFSHHIGQRELFAAQQADRGIIKAVRKGKPGANYLSDQIMPLKREIAVWVRSVHMRIFDTELRGME